MRTAALALRLLRLGGRRAALSAGLIAAGVAVGTMLLTLALGGLHGWDTREARTGWRADLSSVDSAADPVVLAAGRTEYAAGRPIEVVEVAGVGPTAPPPGLSRMPAPGEVWVSPALADLLAALPANELADRFPTAVPTGTVADLGLRGPDELYALVGRYPGDPALADATGLPGFAAPSGGVGMLEVYRQLTYVAVALLVFPVASLLGASARLTAARRVERLALLRLLGASTRQVTVAAVTEVTAVATAAAVLGVVGYWLLAPAVALIEFGGGQWFADDVRPAPPTLLLIVVGVALLATGAAVGGTRQVVIGPLGAVKRQDPGGARLIRLVGVVVGVGLFMLINNRPGAGPANVTGLVFGVTVLIMFGTVSLIGPLVVRLLGARMVRSARSVGSLLAGRRLVDDPKGAFRPLAGLTLAVFVAGFLAPLTAGVGGTPAGDGRVLRVTAPAEAVQARLAETDLVAGIRTDGEGTAVTPVSDADQVRTTLAPLVPGQAITTQQERTEAGGLILVDDLQRGTVVVLVGTFLIAATATGTAAAARILDHRRTLRLLRLAGTPLTVLDAARRAETVRPLLVLGGIGLASGLLCASPFAAAADTLAPSALVLLGGVVVFGVLLVAAASAASRPLLRSVTTEAARED